MSIRATTELTMSDGHTANAPYDEFHQALAAYKKDPRQWRFRFKDANTGESKDFDLRSVAGNSPRTERPS